MKRGDHRKHRDRNWQTSEGTHMGAMVRSHGVGIIRKTNSDQRKFIWTPPQIWPTTRGISLRKVWYTSCRTDVIWRWYDFVPLSCNLRITFEETVFANFAKNIRILQQYFPDGLFSSRVIVMLLFKLQWRTSTMIMRFTIISSKRRVLWWVKGKLCGQQQYAIYTGSTRRNNTLTKELISTLRIIGRRLGKLPD